MFLFVAKACGSPRKLWPLIKYMVLLAAVAAVWVANAILLGVG